MHKVKKHCKNSSRIYFYSAFSVRILFICNISSCTKTFPIRYELVNKNIFYLHERMNGCDTIGEKWKIIPSSIVMTMGMYRIEPPLILVCFIQEVGRIILAFTLGNTDKRFELIRSVEENSGTTGTMAGRFLNRSKRCIKEEDSESNNRF